jgi:hypothetical protein
MAKNVVHRLRQFVSDDIVSNKLSSLTSMALQMFLVTTPDLLVVPYGVRGSLAECPLQIMVALFAPSTPPG